MNRMIRCSIGLWVCLVWMSSAAWGQVILMRIEDKAGKASSRAAAARDNAAEARDRAIEIRNRVQDGVNNLTEDMRMMIAEAVEDVRKAIAEELEDREGFEDASFFDGQSECDLCRDRVFNFLVDLDSMLVDFQGMTLACTDVRPISLQRVIDLIGSEERQVPCRILVTLCKAFDLADCLVDQVQEAATAINEVRAVIGELDGMEAPQGTDVDNPRSFVDAEVEACGSWLSHYDELVVRQRSLAKAAKALGQVGGQLYNEPCKTGQVGIHGYAHLQLETCVAQKFGTALNSIADATEAVVGAVRTNIARCVDRKTDQAILDQLKEIFCNQDPGDPSCAMGLLGRLRAIEPTEGER